MMGNGVKTWSAAGLAPPLLDSQRILAPEAEDKRDEESKHHKSQIKMLWRNGNE